MIRIKKYLNKRFFGDHVNKEEKQAAILRAYSRVFSGEDGELVLKDLSVYCGLDSVCFHKDERETAFQLGARSAMLYILDQLEKTKGI